MSEKVVAWIFLAAMIGIFSVGFLMGQASITQTITINSLAVGLPGGFNNNCVLQYIRGNLYLYTCPQGAWLAEWTPDNSYKLTRLPAYSFCHESTCHAGT